MSAPDIVCMGEPLVEFVRQEDGATYLRGFGGDTSNAAIAAARQGASVGYVTALGADRFGDAVMALWAEEGVDAAAVRRDEKAPTGIYFVDPDPAERHFTYYRAGSAASLFGPADLPLDYIRAAKVFHLSGITLAVSASLRDAGLAAMEAAAGAGARVSLDTNLRLALWSADEARDVTDRAMAHAAVAVTSIDDSASLTGLTDPDAVIDRYQALGPDIVLVTMGEHGCRVGAGSERRTTPPAAATPIDSTGAGDSFAGSFHAWALEVGDPFEAARRAAVVAAGTVSGLGAIQPIPRRDAVLRALT
ncbi:MAG: sugar kinase [Pseudomonadota bacterium]